MTTIAARPDDTLIAAGSPELRRLQWAMVAGGLAAFALLYATQALLPQIGDAFGRGATAASLTVAVGTGVLALTVLPMSDLAERVGRTRVMAIGLTVACLAVLTGAAAPQFWVLLLLRGVDGLALGGVVAVAMGHIGDEVAPEAAGTAIGVYVSGTTVGGLIGRLVPAGVSDLASWRWALVALAGVAAACLLVFVRLIPASRRRTATTRTSSRTAVARHLRDPGIVRLCLVALLLMGGFVGTYNYLTYRLAEAPFDLSSAAVGLVFLAYLAGTASSTAAARVAARVGRRPVLLGSIGVALVGLLVTLSTHLTLVLVGLVVFTAGFFGAHSVASGWTTGRAPAMKSHASALYLMSYYLGSSVGGTALGFAWAGGGWPATVIGVGACFVVAAVVAAGVRDAASPTDPRGTQPPESSSVGTPGGTKPRI